MLVVVVCYLPPGYNAARGKAALGYITDTVLEMKVKYKDPFIFIGGDFNQWDISEAFEDYQNAAEVEVGPTRGGRCIDRIFVSFHESVTPCDSETAKSQSL